MATTPIASSSAGTIDVFSLVSQLMTVERQPIDKLNTRVASYETKISSFGTISGLVASFQAAVTGLSSNLQAFSASSSDTSIFTAVANSAATAGNYALEVSKLAQSQNLVAMGQSSSTTSISDGTATTVTFDFGTISGGTLTNGTYSGATFTSNGNGTTSITIDGTNNTLQGIRDAINGTNAGVSATIINDGSGTPYRLALTSTVSGVGNSLKISTSGGDGTINSLLGYDPTAVQNLNQTIAAQDAKFTLNGIAISKASNIVTDAIDGVELTLNKITTVPSNLVVARDNAAIKSAASSFVETYNSMVSQLKSRSAYGIAGSPAPVLSGDGTVRLMLNQLRSIFTTAASGGTLTHLTQVGISLQADGTLKLDSNKFENAVNTDFNDVTNLFSSATGFATRLDTWSTSVLTSGGLIETRTQSLNTAIKGYNDQIDRLENRMTALQKLYTTQFSNLNVMLSNMNSISTYLTQQFAKTSGA